MTDDNTEIITTMGQSASDIPIIDGESHNEPPSFGTGSNNSDEDKTEFPGGEESNKHRPTLEWNFIDFTKADRCPIYDVDPVMLKRFIGHNVTVINSSREKFQGCCLTIDPVSLSVILARRTDTGNIRIITLPGYHLKKIYIDPDCVPKEYSVSVNDLDIAELYHAKSLLSESSTSSNNLKTGNINEIESQSSSQEVFEHCDQTSSASNRQDTTAVLTPSVIVTDNDFTTVEIQIRKKLVQHLLAKNHLPCTEKGEDLELPGGVKIKPPYTIESCDAKNTILKRKLGELLQTLKKKP